NAVKDSNQSATNISNVGVRVTRTVSAPSAPLSAATTPSNTQYLNNIVGAVGGANINANITAYTPAAPGNSTRGGQQQPQQYPMQQQQPQQYPMQQQQPQQYPMQQQQPQQYPMQ